MTVETETVDAKVYYRVEPCGGCGTEVRELINERDARLLTTPKEDLEPFWESWKQQGLIEKKLVCPTCAAAAEEERQRKLQEAVEAAHQAILSKYEHIMGATVADLRPEDNELVELVVEKDGKRYAIYGAGNEEDDHLHVKEDK